MPKFSYENMEIKYPTSLKLRGSGYDIFILWYRTKTSSCQLLINALAPPPITQESYSTAQTDRPVF